MYDETVISCTVVVHIAISTHSPRAGRDDNIKAVLAMLSKISIHSPHMGRDVALDEVHALVLEISIHSPHAERDSIRGFNSL